MKSRAVQTLNILLCHLEIMLLKSKQLDEVQTVAIFASNKLMRIFVIEIAVCHLFNNFVITTYKC